MSGPKDYTFLFDAMRLAIIRKELQAMARVRRQQAQKHAADARSRTEDKLRQMRQSAAKQQTALGDSLREKGQRIRDAAPKVSRRKGATDQSAVPPVSVAEVPAPNPAAEEAYQQLSGWQATLAGDHDTQTFRADAYKQWKQEADILLARTDKDGLAGVEEQLKGMVRSAQQLHEQAGEVEAKYHTRNLLIRDVIDSMKSIGYFVADPFFESPDDPTAPVILNASMAGQTMSASIGLSDTIHSVWNGVEHEACKDTFFKYIDEMKSRGVQVEPTRADLRDRPKLKQLGTKELPRSGVNQRES